MSLLTVVVAVIWVLGVWTPSPATSQTTRYNSYNSSDLSYLSNEQQASNHPADHMPPQIKWLARLYDHFHWSPYVNHLNDSQVCQHHMRTYIEHLTNGTPWANKMYDASGRYSTQFFFGNDYWLGSKTLCAELMDPSSGAPGDTAAPFPLQFYVVKVRININEQLTPVTRQLNVGECMPKSCSKRDLHLLMAQERNLGVSLNVIEVRPVPGGYVVWDDVKFQIISIVCLVVGMIMLMASLLELTMDRNARRKLRKGFSEVENNNNNSININGGNNHNNNNNHHINNYNNGLISNHSNNFNSTSCSRINIGGSGGGGGLAYGITTTAAEDVHTIKGNNNREAVIIKSDELGRKGDVIGAVAATIVGSDGKNSRFQQNIAVRILLCFSAISNGRKILDVGPVSLDSIRCIHGLRVFSIAWIILVHTYLEVFSIADNKTMRIITERNFMYQTISNATFSVDTFFYISGLLVTLTYFRTESKKQRQILGACRVFTNHFLKFFMLVIYRFFRLTPAYLLVLGINEIIMRYLHSHSVFSPAIIDHISCKNFWWRNALYINNFYPQQEFCMLWSWYISNDTQFYFIAVFLLLIAVRGEKQLKFAGAAVGIFMVSSWMATFMIAVKHKYVIRVEEPFALFDQLYDKPWMRIGPYLVGIIAGYYLFKANCRLKLSRCQNIIGWTLSLACLSSLVYGVGKEGIHVPLSAFYAALGHTAWGISLAWITVSCCSGFGGPLNSLFSFRLFLPLSRLTYCAYLIHPVLMCITSFILDGPIHLHEVFVIVIYFGNVILAFLCAFFISLAFEAPVVNLLKIIF